MTKHDLKCTTLSRVRFKKILYLFFPLLNKSFQVDHIIQEEIFRLKKNAQYKLAIVFLKSYHLKILIVKSFNTCSSTLHFEDIFMDSNLLASHILCLNETRIKECSFKLTKLQRFITKVPCIIML